MGLIIFLSMPIIPREMTIAANILVAIGIISVTAATVIYAQKRFTTRSTLQSSFILMPTDIQKIIVRLE